MSKQKEVDEAFARIVRNANWGISSNDYELMNPIGFSEEIGQHLEDVDTIINNVKGINYNEE